MIVPFYFGNSQKPLFGVYHQPQDQIVRSCAIVLCYPIGHEYIYAHRAFRQLALLLNREGFHVLRFDYYGCGDSAGDSNDWDIEQWLQDIRAAIGELKDKCGLSKVSLIGLRLGATLSLLSVQGEKDVGNIVLWDPIYTGNDYLAALKSANEIWYKDTFKDQDCQLNINQDILGFHYNTNLQKQIEDINLLNLKSKMGSQLLLLENNNSMNNQTYLKHFKNYCHNVEFNSLNSHNDFLQDSGMNKVIVPGQTLQLIIKWIKQTS